MLEYVMDDLKNTPGKRVKVIERRHSHTKEQCMFVILKFLFFLFIYNKMRNKGREN
jgi:hypothetical protein